MVSFSDNYQHLLPWHQSAWEQFNAYQQQQRLPHALLLNGMPGLGKKMFAEQMARILLCEKKPSSPLPLAGEGLGERGLFCGQCFSCRLTAINEHPDYFELTPAEEGKTIKVEQVRELIESLQQTSHRIGKRIIVISPAETMNNASSNALLKTLEEPGAHCHFLLISHAAAQLSATIRSRCQSLRFSPDFGEKTVEWVVQQTKQTPAQAATLLKEAEGAPQRAVELAESGTQQMRTQVIEELSGLLQNTGRLLVIALSWQQRGLIKVLDEMIFILNQLVTAKLAPSKSGDSTLAKLLQIPVNNLINYTHYIMQVKKELVINPNLNSQLLSETVLLEWLKQVRKG